MNGDVTEAQLAAWAATMGRTLAAGGAQRVLRWLDAMLELNQHLNLTAIRTRDQALVLHVLDSLVVARVKLDVRAAADLGSGNGFPGVAVAALWPQAEVCLVERTAKKAKALTQLAERAGFEHVVVAHLDAAQVHAVRPELQHRFDLVTARAVGEPAMIAGLAEPWLAAGGQLVLWLDQDADVPLRLTRTLRLVDAVGYALPEPAARARKLAIYRDRD